MATEVVNNPLLTDSEVRQVVKALKDTLTEIGLMKDGKMTIDFSSGKIPFGELTKLLLRLSMPGSNIAEKFKGISEVLPILEKCKDL
jgi:hypothetical protein